MTWTIVPDHGTLHIRAIVRDPRGEQSQQPSELRELVVELSKYLEEDDGRAAPVHPRSPAPDGTNDAAARTGHERAEKAAQAAREQCDPTEITVSTEGVTATAGTAASHQAEGRTSSADRFGRRVPRYDD